MRDLLAVFKCSDAPVSASSCAAYKTYASTLTKELGNTDLYALLKDADRTIAWITKHYGSGDASKKNMMAAVLAIFKHNKGLELELSAAHRKWRAAYEEIAERIDERYKENRPSTKQNEGYVPYADIIAKRDALDKGSAERLLLSMYTHIRPLRGDFGKVRVYTTARLPAERTLEDNYVHIPSFKDSPVIVLNEYKTAKHKGEYKRPLPPPLVTEIQASLKKRPRDWLFVKADGSPYELGNSYVRWANNTLKRLFGCGLTLSLIRHSFISSLDFNTLSIAEKEEIAEDMAHTVHMQDKYRFIFDEKKSSKS
jgi:hypothetical protein